MPRSRVEFGFAMLASTGTAFAPGPVERPTRFRSTTARLVIGDFSGDGTPRAAVERWQSRAASRSRVSGGPAIGFLVDTRMALPVGGQRRDVVDAVVSDVDGNGVDDVVYTTSFGRGRKSDGFRVLRLDGPGVEPSEIWAPTPRCPAGDCSFYFQNSY